MSNDNWREYIKKACTEYYKIGSILCPAFGNELVYFNKRGFNHLLYKGKDIRSRKEQSVRLNLVSCAVSILQASDRPFRSSTDIIGGYKAYFWAFRGKVGSVWVRIVVRQLGKGRKHFFSVMEEGFVQAKSPD